MVRARGQYWYLSSCKLLLIMIAYDASLHIVELIGKTALHPLYPNFPLFGFIPYNIFWTVYWSIAFIIMLTILRSRTIDSN